MTKIRDSLTPAYDMEQLQDQIDETLIQKNRRLRQSKCKHEEVVSSFVLGPDSKSETRFCLDCGKDLSL